MRNALGAAVPATGIIGTGTSACRMRRSRRRRLAAALQWLQSLAGKGAPSQERDTLKAALREIEKYNKRK